MTTGKDNIATSRNLVVFRLASYVSMLVSAIAIATAVTMPVPAAAHEGGDGGGHGGGYGGGRPSGGSSFMSSGHMGSGFHGYSNRGGNSFARSASVSPGRFASGRGGYYGGGNHGYGRSGSFYAGHAGYGSHGYYGRDFGHHGYYGGGYRPFGPAFVGYGFFYDSYAAWPFLGLAAWELADYSYLNEEEVRAQENAVVAATSGPIDEPSSWDDGTANGAVTPIREGHTADGETCREFKQQVTVDGQTQQAYGTACQQPDGSWQIVDDNADESPDN